MLLAPVPRDVEARCNPGIIVFRDVVEETRQRIILQGAVPSPAYSPAGGNFITRFPKVIRSEEGRVLEDCRPRRSSVWTSAW